MKKLVFLALLFAVFSACSNSAPVSEKTSPNESPETLPSVSKDSRYKGGFTKEMRVSDAEMIVGILERNYAPRELKEKYFGLSFEDHSKKFIDDAANDMKDEEFYALIAKYLAAFRDGHIQWEFPSLSEAWLRFNVTDIGGKLYVSSVGKRLEGEISIGDELLTMNGRKATEVRDEFLQFSALASPQSRVQGATNRLTFRKQSRIALLPDNTPIKTVFLDAKNGSTKELELRWARQGTGFGEFNDAGIDLKSQSTKGNSARRNLIEELRDQPGVYLNENSNSAEDRAQPSFDTGPDFTKRKDKPLVTGVFVHGDKKIGYIRLHSFLNEHISFDETFAELEEEIPYLEENTDGLIIDLNDNGGGDGCFQNKITSMFFGSHIEETKEMLRANRFALTDFEYWMYDYDTPKEDSNLASVIVDKIRRSLKQGALLTEAFPLCRLDGTYEPYTTESGDRVFYSKPILILTSYWSASAADIFAIYMQESGRAKTFGQPTMGAGGNCITAGDHLGYSEISLSYTASLLLRNIPAKAPDGTDSIYIENTGAIPDFPYEPTYDDLMTGNVPYREAMLRAAASVIEAAKASE